MSPVRGSGIENQPTFRRTSPRRSVGAGPILRVIAVLSTTAAIAAWISGNRNAARAARYSEDPGCQSSLAEMRAAASTSACSVEPATVIDRYIHTYKGSHYYRYVMRTADGVADTVELQGTATKTLWDALPIGAIVPVQRYTDTAPGKRHVTALAAQGRAAQTWWNPAWLQRDRTLGTWFFGITAALSVLALSWKRAPPR